jgi:tRNA threonylcarbamoyl adenosine modification protein YeaZ
MQTLFIDLASNKQLLALVGEDTTLAIREADERFDEAELMPVVEALCKEAGIKLKTINRVACTTGPGGFMSQRVGAALANALAYSIGVPAAGIHLSDLWNARVMDSDKNQIAFPLVWLHSTKRTHLFYRDLIELGDPVLIEIKTLSALPNGTKFVGELIDEHAALISGCERLVDIAPTENILPAVVNSLTYANAQILPWYGRGA